MKKSYFLLSCFISLISFSSFAGDDDKDIQKGIRAGFQSSILVGDGLDNTDPYSSFYVGLLGEKKLIPLLRLGGGLEYHQTGAKIANTDIKRVRNNLSIPLYGKVKLGPLFATAGVSPSFGLGEKLFIGDDSEKIEGDDKLKTFDMPVQFGLGLKILFFSIDARYNIGLPNLSNYDGESVKQNYLQVGASIYF